MALSDTFTQNARDVGPIQHLGIKKLVVFRALRLGDMLCSVPALRALRLVLPYARISLVGLPWAEQFANRFHKYIDDFFAFPGHPAFPEQPAREDRIPAFYQEMREHHFDLALQMHGSGQVSNHIIRKFGANAIAGFTLERDGKPRTGFFVDYPDVGAEPLRLLRLAEYLGAPAMTADLEFPITEQDQQELYDAELSRALVPRHYICIHPGASARSKCWPAERFAEVADALALEFELPILLTGSANELDLTTAVARRMRANAINAAAPVSIGAMAALMSRARLLVCNDTGVSHIAAGLKLPSVVIFSASDMSRWAPLDQTLHRCIRDPEGTQVASVLRHARELIAGASCASPGAQPEE